MRWLPHFPCHPLLLGLCALVLCLGACSGGTSRPTVAHTLTVTAQPAHALTFYEGEEDEVPEPFTPFLVSNGPNRRVISFGFSQFEGAYYLASYDPQWNERDISNGFQPSDPKWDCDQNYDTAVVSGDVNYVARPCTDGSLTIFAEGSAIPLFHQVGTPGVVGLGARVPVAAFAPNSLRVALTDDGPAGPGQTITLYTTDNWAKGPTIEVLAGLLSRPGWSADGTRLAVVTLDGTLHLWDTTSGAEVATARIPRFTVGTAASDPAGPAPQWSPDGNTLIVTTPGGAGTLLTSWMVSGGTLMPHASATVAVALDTANPQLAPDGRYLFLHTTSQHGQIFTASDLHQVSDFALPGSLTLWTDATHLAVFTTQATVVPFGIG